MRGISSGARQRVDETDKTRDPRHPDEETVARSGREKRSSHPGPPRHTARGTGAPPRDAARGPPGGRPAGAGRRRLRGRHLGRRARPLLDPENPTAAEIIERARAALDERSVQELVKRATELIERGSLTEALGLCDQALTIAPGTASGVELRDTLDRLRPERERERQRLERPRAATAPRETALAAGRLSRRRWPRQKKPCKRARARDRPPGPATGARGIEQGPEGRPGSAGGADGRGGAAGVRGRRPRAGAGDPDAFEGDHPHVAETLEALTREKARLDREAERLRRQRVDEAIALANAEPSHENAHRASARRSRGRPVARRRRRLLEDRQHALSVQREEARQAREREATDRRWPGAGGRRRVPRSGDLAAGVPRFGSPRTARTPPGTRSQSERRSNGNAKKRGVPTSGGAASTRCSHEARRTPDHDAAIGLLQEALTLGPDTAT